MSRTPETVRMERLIQEYAKEGDENLEDPGESTEQGARLLALQMSLEAWDVEDRGEEREVGTPRYALEAKMMVRVDKIACELQLFLEKASALVVGRTRFFRVDPEDAILPILRGCGSMAQLVAAWEIMRKRLELGQAFFKKYLKEFRYPDSIEDYSPASTTMELKESLAEHKTGDARLRHLMAYYPHHNGGLRDYQDRLRVMSADWDTVIQLARGEEMPEVREEDVSYDSQYQTRPDDTSLFDNDPDEEETVIEGKRKSILEVEDSSSKMPTMDPKLEFVDQLRKTGQSNEEVPVNTALMAPATPFKTPQQFLAGLVNVNIGQSKIPPAVPVPNVLKRLGVGPMGTVGDAYRSSFGKPDASQGVGDDTPEKPKSAPLPSRPSNVFESTFDANQQAVSSTPLRSGSAASPTDPAQTQPQASSSKDSSRYIGETSQQEEAGTAVEAAAVAGEDDGIRRGWEVVDQDRDEALQTVEETAEAVAEVAAEVGAEAVEDMEDMGEDGRDNRDHLDSLDRLVHLVRQVLQGRREEKVKATLL
ncbi:hypothetical protein C8R47DRAFT_1220059 [Mycena vitilis]|nr:hypothetical protein C8R47DRAFT_1220059 [Mycena vitilis]